MKMGYTFKFSEDGYYMPRLGAELRLMSKQW